MERWLRITENGHGECSVLDIERNYRICSFNHASHGGVHLHLGKVTQEISIESLDDAKGIARRYARSHDKFTLKAFEKVVNEWNSEPSIG